MKPSFFNPDWRKINEAINSGSDGLHALRLAEKDLKKKIQAKVDKYFKDKREREAREAEQALRAFPKDYPLYYMGRSGKLKFGTAVKKVSDGHVYMRVIIDGVNWKIIYSNLRSAPPTEQEYKDFRLGVHISKIFNKAINHYSNERAKED